MLTLKNRIAATLTALLFLLHSNVLLSGTKTEFEQEISKVIAEESLTGIVWSTVSNNNVVVGSAGLSNSSTQSAMNAYHKVQVGSVTKAVLAIGVMRLITTGKLSLSSNVEALLPTLSINNPWHKTDPITVGHLLEHSAGLDNFRMWQFLNSQVDPYTPLAEVFPAGNSTLLSVRSKPGTQYSYSNMGYTLLGMVIESITGERYENYLDNKLLKPLGMHESTFEYISQTGKHADKKMAMGYYENNVAQAAIPMYLRPAGQFTTTASDMAKFMQFLLSDGRISGGPFIDPILMNLLASPIDTDAKKTGLQIGHGLVLAGRDRHKVLGACHPGTTFGFRAYLCLFPDEKKSFFYAINTDNDSANYERFNALFIQLLSVKKSPIEQTLKPTMDITNLEGTYIPSPNNMAEFEWLDLLFNFNWLVKDGHKIILKSLQNEDRTLIPMNGQLLRATDRTKASHGIIIDETGNLLLTDGISTVKKYPAIILILYWISLITGVVSFIYIFLIGVIRVIGGDTNGFKTIALPFFNILALAIAVYLLSRQSFLRFGEPTTASFSLFLTSGLLPLTLLVSVFLVIFRSVKTRQDHRDTIALLILFQLCIVLVFWRMLPIAYWY